MHTLSASQRADLAERELERSRTGRQRLRAALAEQRVAAEEQAEELDRQLLAAQRQLRELEDGGRSGGGGSEVSSQQLDELDPNWSTVVTKLINSQPCNPMAMRQFTASACATVGKEAEVKEPKPLKTTRRYTRMCMSTGGSKKPKNDGYEEISSASDSDSELQPIASRQGGADLANQKQASQPAKPSDAKRTGNLGGWMDAQMPVNQVTDCDKDFD